MNATRFFVFSLLGALPGVTLALTLYQSPLFLASTEPRVMLTLSRDHQLSIKAYTDYSDLNDDGTLDTTYNDSIDYFGYFDSNKCYTYQNSRYEPSAGVSAGTHQCNGSTWSGNFLNWATMTRMDVLRKTLYGGYRSTDTVGSGYETVLERHFLPDDVHAFVKVYTPSASMPSIQSLTGISGLTSVSLCNVSMSNSSTLTGLMTSLPDPRIRVARGSFPQWDSSEVTQCATGSGTRPSSSLVTDYVARVKVCDSSAGLESNCKTYTNPATGAQTIKPGGLLQQYGDVDADRRVRFGLMTGSYAANKSGGVLRKNAVPIANNNRREVTNNNSNTDPGTLCSNRDNSTTRPTTNVNANDEVDVCTGQFVNQASNQAGIINTLNRIRIAGFQYSANTHEYSCDSPGKLSFNNGQCVDWGNPLGETYLESLRYFANVGATSTFDVSDAAILASIPSVTWTDPLPSDEWCALSSVILLSTGLNSFDTDELASFTPSGGSAIDADTLTNEVGNLEGISGSYLIGENGSDNNKQCTAKTVSSLSEVKGICPQVPSKEGGYGVAGLAYGPKTIDLRPAYAAERVSRWGTGTTPINPDWALRQPMNTYAVQLAESLPSFDIPVGTGTVTLLPACQANSNSDPGDWTPTSTGWRNCSMTNLIVDDNVAEADVGTDTSAKTNTCSGNGTTSRCFTVAWEDSTWGNDYDMDGIERVGYCVGTACDSFKMLCPTTSSAYATIGPWASVSPGEIVIAACAIQAQAGHTLTFGYTITGTTSDGASYPIYRRGGRNFNVGSLLPSDITAPQSSTFTQGTSTADLLENPLWYAAKYGGFTESSPTSGTPEPDVTSEWDTENNVTGAATPDGIPDNYYNVRNPATLIAALSEVLDEASQPDAAAASVATNSTNLQTNSFIYQGRFSSADWSGQLLAYALDMDGTIGALQWDAAIKMAAQDPADRVILTKGATDGVAFEYANLTGATIPTGSLQDFLDKSAAGFSDGCGPERVAFLRGDHANEGVNGVFPCASGNQANRFRKRFNPTSSIDFKLGDIVNSNPWYLGAPEAGYADSDHPGYYAFATAKSSRVPVVYVGGNDGMLHGIDATTGRTTSGQEVLAYVPSAVYPNLSRLTDRDYNRNHRYFVDGSPMVADADLGSSTSPDWRSVLIGGLGAGGKGYYALDVSNPAAFDESNAADTLLWEFTEADDADMGYAYNLPPASTVTEQAKQIVKMANGKWAAILGNGYGTSAGKAVLYILFIEDGVDGIWTAGDFVKIVADVPAALDNGLSTPVPFDSNYDGVVDTVYAGDLKGNLWKFLVGPNASDAAVTVAPSTWKVAFSTCDGTTGSPCTPLFTAKDCGGGRQPIVAPPEVSSHPEGGQLVMFGTGKYLEFDDNESLSPQAFYGIWDDGTPLTNTRDQDLLEQTVALWCIDAACTTGRFRLPSANSITWRVSSGGDLANCTGSCTPTHRGWYMDLLAIGVDASVTGCPTPTTSQIAERVTGIPEMINGTIYFNTLIPSDLPCDAGGSGWLMSLDYLTGGLVSTRRIFDTNGSGAIDSSDVLTGGYQVGAAIGGTTLIQNPNNTAGTNIGVGVSSLTSGNLGAVRINFGLNAAIRLNWREIVQ
ncbi:Tfp pilus assembly protein, tip-associated adhesin PilY1 [Thioflavicoccus mobilis 8321]|uniref:Tfp pilus assembly protein, tip-associated adhesin PilY1 n=1 Tax=Thioflavicoccus mobilis 8321 TaxID=765912 RepID=L0H2G5_9GAMM|nr:PilC/PilY family type IV pilus protein [Thioflavicoccus mobilis]AGA91845.1 Tfp pilus assembly protein, tip-associated adhesin PilY1 [Thioflavicoccus mobilis 8321]